MSLPHEYRLELSDQLNTLALEVVPTLRAMSLNELTKVQAQLQSVRFDADQRSNATNMLKVLALIGMGYVEAIEKSARQRREDVAAADAGTATEGTEP